MMSIIKEKETDVILKETHIYVMDHYIASKPDGIQMNRGPGMGGPLELEFAGTLEHLI